jgi:hypothetical protein
MLVRLGLCVDPGLAATAGIVPKVLRALDPSFAKNPRDARLRELKLRKIMGGVIEEGQIGARTEYPTTIVRAPTSNRRFVSIPAANFRRLTEKIVRGIVYVDRQAFIEPTYVIEHHAIGDEASKPIVDVLDRFGTTFANEPGIVVRRAVSKEDPIASVFSIEVWKSFKMFAFVDDPTRNGADPDVVSLTLGHSSG